MVTIDDVAKAAGVSKSTVSRYLNKSGYVSETTAQQIDQAVQSLHYTANDAARSLVAKRTNKISLLVSTRSALFWNVLLDAIHQEINQADRHFDVVMMAVDYNNLNLPKQTMIDKFRFFAEQRVEGIILTVHDTLSDAEVEYLKATQIPFVTIQSHARHREISSVNVDNEQATYNVVEHLAKLGHQRISYVAGPLNIGLYEERYTGYRNALVDFHLEQDSRLELQSNNSTSDGYWRIKQLLSLQRPPTAVVFATDQMAYGGLKAAQEMGVRVPEDLSIVGFDGVYRFLDLLSYLPKITTVEQPIELIGKQAVSILFQQMQDKENGISKIYRDVLPTRFCPEGTAGPPPGKG